MVKSRFRAPRFLRFLLLGCGGAAVLALEGCASRSSAPLWNLPPLIGQPMDVAQKTLGPPKSETTLAPGTIQSLWQREGITLSATWKSRNGRVTAYQLLARDDTRALREGETAPLLVPGQLTQNDPRYSIEWIEAASRPLFYTGVKVVPAPRSHTVVIRVTASEALVRVVYQVSSAGGNSDDLLTIAPWEASFTLPEDARVTLSGGLYKRLSQKPFQMKLEILADGKVVASATSTGTAASCNYEL